MKAKSIAGHQDAQREDDRLHADRADRRLPVRMDDAGNLPRFRRKSGSASRGSRESTGAMVIASGPYMIEGSEEVNVSSCGAHQADQRAIDGETEA